MAEIGMQNSDRVAIVDDADVATIAEHRWFTYRIGRTHYAMATHQGERIYMHRLIMGNPYGEVDHRNNDGLNNRRSNLRVAPHALNLANQRPQVGRSSRYKGVSWNRKQNVWEAYIKVNRRKRRLGWFTSEIEAAKVYDAAAIAAWGEFARPNFPGVLVP